MPATGSNLPIAKPKIKSGFKKTSFAYFLKRVTIFALDIGGSTAVCLHGQIPGLIPITIRPKLVKKSEVRK